MSKTVNSSNLATALELASQSLFRMDSSQIELPNGRADELSKLFGWLAQFNPTQEGRAYLKEFAKKLGE